MRILKSLQTLEPTAIKNLLILFICGLCFWISITSFLPTLPAYIKDLGATPHQVGIVMGCFAIGLLASRNILGKIADHKSRKQVVLIGTAVAAIAPIGYLLIHDISGLMIVRAFHGISIAAFTTGFSALVVDLSPVKQRGELIGYMTLTAPIGMSVAPAFATFLQESFGYEYLFISAASFAAVGFILTNWIHETPRELLHFPHQQDNPGRNFWQILRTPSLSVLAFVLLMIGLVFGSIVSFLPLFIREVEVDLSAGLFYTAAAMGSFSARIFTGKASDYYGRGLFITGSIICYAIAMLLLTTCHDQTSFIIAAILEGTGGGIIIPMMISLMSDRSYAHERGQVYAVCIGGFDLGIALAGPILGAFALSIGYRGIFLMASSLAIIALFAFLALSNKDLSTSLGFALGKQKDIYAVDK